MTSKPPSCKHRPQVFEVFCLRAIDLGMYPLVLNDVHVLLAKVTHNEHIMSSNDVVFLGKHAHINEIDKAPFV